MTRSGDRPLRRGPSSSLQARRQAQTPSVSRSTDTPRSADPAAARIDEGVGSERYRCAGVADDRISAQMLHKVAPDVYPRSVAPSNELLSGSTAQATEVRDRGRA